MARRSISIDEKINQQKQVVFQAKDKYDAAVAELDNLMKKVMKSARKNCLMPLLPVINLLKRS